MVHEKGPSLRKIVWVRQVFHEQMCGSISLA